MASRLRGEITLDLDKPRVWRINLLAMERIEQRLKETKPEINYDMWVATRRDWTVRDYVLLLWAGLARGEPQLSEDDLMEMMDGSDLSKFKMDLMRLEYAALPEEAKKNLIDTADTTTKLLLGLPEDSGSSPSSSTG
jgi:hypothetical protein